MNKAIPKVKDTVSVTEVSMETGEVKEYSKNIYEELEIQRCIDYSKKRDELSMIMDNEFGKYFLYFYNSMRNIDIPINIKARFLYLCTYVGYDSYLVDVWRTDRRYLTPLTRTDLYDKLMLSEREFKITIKSLIDSGLLIQDEKYYKVNDTVIVRGSTDKKSEYTRVFFNGVKELYENCKPIQHKQLYYFFMILPYINLQHNVLCSNVGEEMYEKVEALNIKDMCKIVGYDVGNYSKLQKNMLQFRIGDKSVMSVTMIGNGSFIKINPSVYYAGTRVEDLKSLMGEFQYILH